MAVIVRENEVFESAWKRFMRDLISNGVMDELKERTYYKKPSLERSVVNRELKKRKTRHHRAVRKLKSKYGKGYSM
ncbi:30S ribosomal protein S21 [Patescibacteria group bacterium]|nr:30S ribosomal protein S21 [Patescibacteria group bacterium]